MDTVPTQASSAPTAHAGPAEASPFVMDTQEASAPANVVQSTQKSQGTLSIVKNGDTRWGPQPATTSMVMAKIPGATTTAHPTTSRLQFELGDSMIEVSPGQMFVPIPDTPFEMERHTFVRHMSLAKESPKGRSIELLRPGVEMPSALLVQTAAAATAPHVSKRLMRNEELQVPGILEEEDSPGIKAAVETGHASPIAATPGTNPITDDPITTQTPLKALPPSPKLTKAEPVETSTTLAAEPIHAQNVLNTPAEMPSAQIPTATSSSIGDAATSNADAPIQPSDTNNSLSAPAAIMNGTLGGLSNATNATVHTPKVVTAKGAVVSILVGLLVTIFFLTLVLCILKAGLKETPEEDEKEPPRPTPSYRQLLRAQQQPEAAQAASSPPSA